MNINYNKISKATAKIKENFEAAKLEISNLKQERDKLRSILDGILHETRGLNLDISSFCEALSKSIDGNDFESMREHADSVLFASGLISSRMTFADFELNPQSLSRQGRIRMGIYKKFDKSKRLIQKARRTSGAKIKFKGSSFAEIEAIPALELVPYVLLDNAVKYSPKDQDVEVLFEDRPSINCHTKVTVSSVGPTVSPEEIDNLRARGFRSKSARDSKLAGDGLGLYLADILSRHANAKMKITSSSNLLYSIDGTPYSEFRVELDFYK